MSNGTFEDQRAEFLEHYGKKGMKWGERRAAKRVARDDRDREIVGARARQTKRAASLNQKAAATYVQTTKKGQEAAEAAYAKAEKAFINHPDVKKSQQLTHGEKVTTGILAGTMAAAAFGAAFLATSH